MNSVEYPEDSDSSDEDYVPENAPKEVVSEVESDGDAEDPLSDKEDLGTRGSTKRRKKGSKAKKKLKKEIKTGGKDRLILWMEFMIYFVIILDSSESTPEKPEITEEEKKKQEDDLWADFKKETNFKARPTNVETINSKETKENENIEQKKKVPEKVKVTQIFEFAGEEVKVEKEVAVNSSEAKLLNTPSGSHPPKRGRGRSTGIGSVLSQIGKKQKINTLEKSKLDWDKFKREENLEEELNNFNKGKDGYVCRYFVSFFIINDKFLIFSDI